MSKIALNNVLDDLENIINKKLDCISPIKPE